MQQDQNLVQELDVVHQQNLQAEGLLAEALHAEGLLAKALHVEGLLAEALHVEGLQEDQLHEGDVNLLSFFF